MRSVSSGSNVGIYGGITSFWASFVAFCFAFFGTLSTCEQFYRDSRVFGSLPRLIEIDLVFLFVFFFGLVTLPIDSEIDGKKIV